MPTHTNTTEMLNDMAEFAAAHPGAKVWSQDDHEHSWLQFFVLSDELEEAEEFSIRLQDLRRTPPDRNSPAFTLIRTKHGREQLAKALEVHLPFDLKAHLKRSTSWAHLLEDNGL